MELNLLNVIYLEIYRSIWLNVSVDDYKTSLISLDCPTWLAVVVVVALIVWHYYKKTR